MLNLLIDRHVSLNYKRNIMQDTIKTQHKISNTPTALKQQLPWSPLHFVLSDRVGNCLGNPTSFPRLGKDAHHTVFTFEFALHVQRLDYIHQRLWIICRDEHRVFVFVLCFALHLSELQPLRFSTQYFCSVCSCHKLLESIRNRKRLKYVIISS